jgi:hypothetical protein
MVSSIPPDDQFTRWRTEYEVDIKVALASLAGERIFFGGDNSSGVSGDLESATAVATLMEGFWGMGETISSYSVAQRVIGGGGGGPRPGGDEPEGAMAFNQTLGKRIEENLRRLFEETEQLLRDNRREVLAIGHALETYKTLSGEDVAAVVEGAVGPLVDGRIYATAEFLEQAEHYHALAVTAHQGHSAVAVPMPDWRPTPELVAAAPTLGSGDEAAPSPDDPFGYPAAPPVDDGAPEPPR